MSCRSRCFCSRCRWSARPRGFSRRCTAQRRRVRARSRSPLPTPTRPRTKRSRTSLVVRRCILPSPQNRTRADSAVRSLLPRPRPRAAGHGGGGAAFGCSLAQRAPALDERGGRLPEVLRRLSHPSAGGRASTCRCGRRRSCCTTARRRTSAAGWGRTGSCSRRRRSGRCVTAARSMHTRLHSPHPLRGAASFARNLAGTSAGHSHSSYHHRQ